MSLERNMERRRCIIERFGVERFIREVDAKLVSKDRSGRLWQVDFKGVTSNNAQQLWKGRKKLFLKPAGGPREQGGLSRGQADEGGMGGNHSGRIRRPGICGAQ